MVIPLSEQKRQFNAPQVKQGTAVVSKPNEQAFRDSSNLVGAVANLANTLVQNAEQTKADEAYTKYFNEMSKLNSDYLKLQGKQAIDGKDELNKNQDKALAELQKVVGTLSPQMQNKLKQETSEANNQFRASNSGHLFKQTIVYEDSVHVGKQDANARMVANKAQQLIQLGVKKDFDKLLNPDIQKIFNESMSHYTRRGLSPQAAGIEARKELAASMQVTVNTIATNLGDSAAIDFLNTDIAKKAIMPDARVSMLHDYQKDELSRLAYIKDPTLFNPDGTINKNYLKNRYTNLTDYEKEVIIKSSEDANKENVSLEQKRIYDLEAQKMLEDIDVSLQNLGLFDVKGKSVNDIYKTFKDAKTADGNDLNASDILAIQRKIDYYLRQDQIFNKLETTTVNSLNDTHRKLNLILNAIGNKGITEGDYYGVGERGAIYVKDLNGTDAVWTTFTKLERERTGRKDWWIQDIFYRNKQYNVANVTEATYDFFENYKKPLTVTFKDANGNTFTKTVKIYNEDKDDPNGLPVSSLAGIDLATADWNSLNQEQKQEFERLMIDYYTIRNYGITYNNNQINDMLKTIRESSGYKQSREFADTFLMTNLTDEEIETRRYKQSISRSRGAFGIYS